MRSGLRAVNVCSHARDQNLFGESTLGTESTLQVSQFPFSQGQIMQNILLPIDELRDLMLWPLYHRERRFGQLPASLTPGGVDLEEMGNIAISFKDVKAWKICPRLGVTPAAKHLHLPASNFWQPRGRWEHADGMQGLCPQCLISEL